MTRLHITTKAPDCGGNCAQVDTSGLVRLSLGRPYAGFFFLEDAPW
jgi:hypothetical protein